MDVCLEVLGGVVFGDPDLVLAVLGEVGGHAGERVAAGATFADEECVSVRHAEDPVNPAHVLQRIVEEDDVDGGLAPAVVLGLLVDDDLEHVLDARLGVGLARVDEVHEEQLVGQVDLVLPFLQQHRAVRLEVDAQQVVQDLAQLVFVRPADHAVSVDSEVLVHAELEQDVGGVAGVFVDHAHALHDTRHVSEVEEVVALGGGRLEGFDGADGGEAVEDEVHDFLDLAADLSVEALRGEVEDGGVDALDLQSAGHGHVDDVELGGEPVRDGVPAPGRRRHRAEEVGFLDFDEELQGRSFVPASVLDQLLDQLEGRLRPELVELGHVEVVDEDDSFLPVVRPELPFRAGVQLRLDDLLELLGGGLGGEVDDAVGVLGLGQLGEEGVHDGSLPRAGHTDHQHGEVVLEVALDQVPAADGLHGLDEQLVSGGVGFFGLVVGGGDDEAVVPLEVLALLDVDVAVVDGLGEREHIFDASDECVEGFPGVLVDHAADGPDDAVGEPALELDPEHLVGAPGIEVDAVLLDAEGVEHAEQVEDQVVLLQRDDVFEEPFALGLEDRVDPLVEEVLDGVQTLFVEASLLLLQQPPQLEAVVAQLVHVHEDHAAARDRRGRGLLEVLSFEDERDERAEADAVAGQGEQLVVVQQRVHGLDPARVDGAVEDDPLLVGRVRLVAERFHEEAEDAVVGLVFAGVEVAVEFVHLDGFGVQREGLDFVEGLRVLGAEVGQGFGEDLVHRGLAGEGFADQHVPVARELGVEELDDLVDAVVGVVELLLDQHVVDLHRELLVFLGLDLELGEEVFEQRHEERDVFCHELGVVHVSDGLDEDQRLFLDDRLLGDRVGLALDLLAGLLAVFLLDLACQVEH